MSLKTDYQSNCKIDSLCNGFHEMHLGNGSSGQEKMKAHQNGKTVVVKKAHKENLLCAKIPSKAWQLVTDFLPIDKTTQLRKAHPGIFPLFRTVSAERLLQIFSKTQWNISEEWTRFLEKNGKYYRTLHCSQVHGICDQTMRLIAVHFPNLTSLSITLGVGTIRQY